MNDDLIFNISHDGINTNLVGDVKISIEANPNLTTSDFLIELEAVMVKYKAVSLNVSFDVFKMMRNKSPEYNDDWQLNNLIRKQKDHINNLSKSLKSNQLCMHDQCQSCHGTGLKSDGNMCIHNLSCPCPKCSPKYY